MKKSKKGKNLFRIVKFPDFGNCSMHHEANMLGAIVEKAVTIYPDEDISIFHQNGNWYTFSQKFAKYLRLYFSKVKQAVVSSQIKPYHNSKHRVDSYPVFGAYALGKRRRRCL